jgi:hypothetical protein
MAAQRVPDGKPSDSASDGVRRWSVAGLDARVGGRAPRRHLGYVHRRSKCGGHFELVGVAEARDRQVLGRLPEPDDRHVGAEVLADTLASMTCPIVQRHLELGSPLEETGLVAPTSARGHARSFVLHVDAYHARPHGLAVVAKACDISFATSGAWVFGVTPQAVVCLPLLCSWARPINTLSASARLRWDACLPLCCESEETAERRESAWKTRSNEGS